jgi:hypothetical protein
MSAFSQMDEVLTEKEEVNENAHQTLCPKSNSNLYKEKSNADCKDRSQTS